MGEERAAMREHEGGFPLGLGELLALANVAELQEAGDGAAEALATKVTA